MTLDIGQTAREAPLREAFEAGQLETVARLSFALYGREILSFVSARLRSREHGQEAFAMFAEDLWVHMPSFRWDCSMRCWMYVLGRSAAHRYATSPHQRAERNEPLTEHASRLAANETIRQATRPYQQSQVKQRMRMLRDRLAPEDQTLLVLRVDRHLSWRELALILHESAEPLAGAAIERMAARHRKRFERIKATLRALAIDEGLLAP